MLKITQIMLFLKFFELKLLQTWNFLSLTVVRNNIEVIYG